ncbi:LOW QUALITY PROTEIN: hypothetical protein HZS_3028 [Henneguya salminicola]|nr:LOW QUALITY PROTEIN: hypothetical protein HZS_3028 [Henneguya salminicola]
MESVGQILKSEVDIMQLYVSYGEIIRIFKIPFCKEEWDVLIPKWILHRRKNPSNTTPVNNQVNRQ